MSISIFSRWIVDHAQYKSIFDALVQDTSRALEGGMPFIFPLLGDSRSGKTALLTDLRARFSDRTSPSGHQQVFYVSMPSAASNEAMAVRIIKGLIGDIPVKGKPYVILEQALGTMRSAGTKVLLLDEANHLVEKRVSERAQSKENRQTADWLKELGDLAGISVVLTGLSHVSRMYADNDQLENRGLQGARLYPYEWSVQADRLEYKNMIDAGIAHLQDNGWQIAVTQDLLTRVSYLGGGGYIGKATDFLVRIEALGNKKKHLDSKLLADAYKDKYRLDNHGDPLQLSTIDDLMLNRAHRKALERSVHSGRKSKA